MLRVLGRKCLGHAGWHYLFFIDISSLWIPFLAWCRRFRPSGHLPRWSKCGGSWSRRTQVKKQTDAEKWKGWGSRNTNIGKERIDVTLLEMNARPNIDLKHSDILSSPTFSSSFSGSILENCRFRSLSSHFISASLVNRCLQSVLICCDDINSSIHEVVLNIRAALAYIQRICFRFPRLKTVLTNITWDHPPIVGHVLT